MVINREIHNWTLCREQETSAHSLLSDASLSNPARQGSGIYSEKDRLQQPEAGDFKKTASSRHQMIDKYMISQRL